MLFIDLDDFKTVNDSLGHAAGDELLVSVAERIRSAIRPEDTCARLGGDEFAVLVEGLGGPEGAVTVARRVLATMSQPLSIAGSEVAVQGSVGIALGSGAQNASEIMRSADLAMYRAKSEGKGRYAVYEPSMHEHVLARLALKADLQRAVVADEFDVHYQPIITLRTGAIAGVEALVRWNHPERGLVLPGAFIGLAEETGLILPLGRHVLHEACRQVAGWRTQGHSHLGVSVNISAKQLASRNLAYEVKTALDDHTLDASALTLEITESVLLDSPVVVESARRAARSRRADRDRRLRHRVLVPQLPPTLPGRHAEDRASIRRGDRVESRTGQARRSHPPSRIDDGPRHGGGGDRTRDAARRVACPQVHVRSGVPLLAPGPGRRDRLDARQRARRLAHTRLVRIATRLVALCLLGGLLVVPWSAAAPKPPQLTTLLARHAPVLVLHPDERFLPVAVDGFLADSDLTRKTEVGWVNVDGPLPVGGSDLRLDQRLCHAVEGLAASPCYQAAEAAHGSMPVVYGAAFRTRTRIDLQYWLWYPYDDFSPTYPAGTFWQVHEGDWEAVSVVLDSSGKPLAAAYSQHRKGKRRAWGAVPKRGVRPLVYVGLGSHANFFDSGEQPLDPRTVEIQVINVMKAYGIAAPADHTGNGRIVRPLLVRVTARAPSWMTFAGAWGETGYLHVPDQEPIAAGAGPTGPAFHRQWRRPVVEEMSWPRG